MFLAEFHPAVKTALSESSGIGYEYETLRLRSGSRRADETELKRRSSVESGRILVERKSTFVFNVERLPLYMKAFTHLSTYSELPTVGIMICSFMVSMQTFFILFRSCTSVYPASILPNSSATIPTAFLKSFPATATDIEKLSSPKE